MAERLGLGVIPGVGWSAAEVQAVSREAEDAGFDAIFAAEVNNDVMATAQLMGAATQRIAVGTWIANIYLRHSYVCAQGAALIADATGGRFVLGLGVSHPPVNSALAIDMGEPPAVLRGYVTAVRKWLKGEGPPTHLPQRPSPQPVSLYVAAVTSRTVELASELADGIMPFLWSADRVKQAKTWIERGRAKASGLGKLDVTVGLPTFVGRRREGHARDRAPEPRPIYDVPLLSATLSGKRLRRRGRRDGERRWRGRAERPAT
jgi:alkanesulfonate monooxygenase SsuD/methylene tetrahydromethanopterin reductase-like flavin-dependent oxidoreductase (luciferase family)